MRKFFLTAILALSASSASAATVGFSLTINGRFVDPAMWVTNTSDSAQILSFEMTVGDTSNNFDRIGWGARSADGLNGGTQTLAFGSDSDGGSSADGGRTDRFELAFTGFDAGEVTRFRSQLDRDDIDGANDDYRSIFFNNGDNPNSVVTVTFSDGTVISTVLNDGPADGNEYLFFDSVLVEESIQDEDDRLNAVPLPAGGLLFLSGLGVMAAMRRRKRA